MEFFQAVHYSDFWALFLGAIISVYLGNFVAQGHAVRLWGRYFVGLVFAGYIAAGIAVLGWSGENLFVCAVRGLLIAGIVHGLLLIALTAYDVIDLRLLTPARRHSAEARARREREARERAEQAERERVRREAQQKWELEAPLREHRQREEETQRKVSAEARARRMKAREACELLFSLHAPDIGNRFTREDMERFFSTYMSDSQSPEDVERGGVELQKVMEAHSRIARPPDKKQSVAELTEWYLSEQQRIEPLSLDERTKKTLLLQLKTRYMEMSEQLLERAQP